MKRGDQLFKAKIISRSSGTSAFAKAASNARECLVNEQTGEYYDFRCTCQLLFSAIFAPRHAPEWVQERQSLWTEVERAETCENSSLAQELEIDLPNELTDVQLKNLVRDFVRDNFVQRGFVADVCIHAPDCHDNRLHYHAHILLPLREIGEEGFGVKLLNLISQENIDKWTMQWTILVNRYLERHGFMARITPLHTYSEPLPSEVAWASKLAAAVRKQNLRLPKIIIDEPLQNHSRQ